jgi:exosome complex component RRP4
MTDEIKVKDKDIVVPGEALAVGMGYLPSSGTYREGDAILASRLGLVKVEGKVIKLVPLSGIYEPKRGDVIIGKVIDVLISGWRFNTNTAYSAVLPLKDASSRYIPKGANLTQYYDLGDYVSMKITNVTSQNLIDVTLRGPGLKKLEGGRIVKVNPYKVPRIIGKQGSMVSMIKQSTGCRIMVGQNGVIWLDGDPKGEFTAVKAIRMIEENSHLSGLTDKVKAFLEKETGTKITLNMGGANNSKGEVTGSAGKGE